VTAADPRDDAPPVVEPGHGYVSVTAAIADVPLRRGLTRRWVLGFAAAFALLNLLLVSVTWLFVRGIGIWGPNQPVAWGIAIVNFVWWIGIGHAGTLISAILLLFRQDWRTSINRFAEAMTLFAVACAGLYPILHLGRPQFFYWLFPYPNTMDLWPQWRSPLVWDVFAISTYLLVSLMFWYVGLVPDAATMRDRARSRLAAGFYGILALGWRGSARHWHRYETAYLMLAGIATPLVVSVHTVVSFDFAISIVPGWHSSIFPPFFVAGAIFSGFAMVLVLIIPVRAALELHDFVTARHLDVMAKVMLASGFIVIHGYAAELFFAWYSGNEHEQYMMLNRLRGPYAPFYWALLGCNALAIQALWWRRARRSVVALFVVALFVNVGMWLERFVIVVTSLHRDYLPSSWDMYWPTRWDWATYAGTFGLFLTLMFLFVRVLPVVSMFEMRELVHRTQPEPAPAPEPDRGAP
jgi:molybdopterin-containing oxidoreductase family membrane subunit